MSIFDKPKKTLYRFLFYYLLILFLPTIFYIYANWQASNIIREEIFKSRAAMLNHTRLGIDNVLTAANNAIYQIANNNRLNVFLLQKQSFNNLDHYEIYQITQDLYPYSIRNPLIADIFIYCFNSDIIFCPGTVYPAWLYYDWRMFYRDKNFAEWKNNLINSIPGRSIQIDNPVIDGKEKSIIFFTQTLPILSLTNKLGIIKIAIDEQELQKILTANGNGYILDGSGRIVTSNISANELPAISPEDLKGSSGFFTVSINRKNYMVSFASSQVTDWKYINIEQEEVFLEKVHYFSRNFVIIVVLCGVLGIILSYFLSKKSYSPINRIIQFITASMGVTTPKETWNEMEFIRDVFINAVKNNARMEEENKKLIQQISQKEKNKNSVLPDDIGIANNIITGMIQSGNSQNIPALQDFLQFYGINLTYKRFLVILVQIEDFSKLISEKTGTDNRQIIHLAIKSIVEELFKNGSHFGYVISLDRDMLGTLVNLNDQIENKMAVEEIGTYTAKLCSFMKENLFTTVSIGIGRIYHKLDDINLSYQDAKTALEFRVINKQQQVIWFDSILDNDKEYYYPIDTELKLVQALKAADLDMCKNLITNILEENFERRNLSIRMAQFVAFTMINTALRTVNAMNLDAESILGEKIHFLNHLSTFRTKEQFHKEIMDIYECICGYLANKKEKAPNSRIKNEALAYIHSHFMDFNFSQTALADALEMSPQYLSRVFKEEAGCNMLEYVNRLRIDQAKQFLSGTDMGEAAIANKVGYTNDKTLIRVFKKYEGITPGQYRTLYK